MSKSSADKIGVPDPGSTDLGRLNTMVMILLSTYVCMSLHISYAEPAGN